MEPTVPLADILADLKALQEEYPDQRITRNFYRHHGYYQESQWQYYFSTFRAFREAVDPPTVSHDDPMLSGWHDAFGPVMGKPISSYDAGECVFLGGQRHKIVAKGPASVRTKRQYWYHDVLDWIKDKREKAPNDLP